MHTRNLVVGITGGSGAIYAARFLKQAVRHYDRILLIMSEQAIQVAQTELCVDLDRNNFSTKEWLGQEFAAQSAPRTTQASIELLDSKSFFTPPASGSFRHEGMVIVPCSMGTAGRIAN